MKDYASRSTQYFVNTLSVDVATIANQMADYIIHGLFYNRDIQHYSPISNAKCLFYMITLPIATLTCLLYKSREYESTTKCYVKTIYLAIDSHTNGCIVIVTAHLQHQCMLNLVTC